MATVLDLPTEERPRERLQKHGAAALTTVELIAVILGRGSRGRPVLQLAEQLLATFKTVDALADASVEELCRINGLGEAKAIQLKAAFALGQRCKGKEEPAPAIRSPVQAHRFLKEYFAGEKREIFLALLLNSRSCYIGTEIIAVGTLDAVPAHPREVFYPAIRRKAAALLLAHNHPSGDPSPSKQDLELTQVLADAGNLLGIPLRDHIIMAGERFHSLRENGFSF